MNNRFSRSASGNLRSAIFYSSEIEKGGAQSKEGGYNQRLNNTNAQKYNRIVPKTVVQHPEQIYTQNLQLRDQIKFVEDLNTKLKTKVVRLEKQKQMALAQIDTTKNFFSVYKNKRKDSTLSQGKMSTKQYEENRKILQSYKEKLEKLQSENDKLKKSLKYFQVKEAQIQNQYLLEELSQMKNKVVKLKSYCSEKSQFEEEKKHLYKEVQYSRDQIKMMNNQMKAKDEEINNLQTKMNSIISRKKDLERKHSRQISSLQKELQYSKQKERELHLTKIYEKKETIKPQQPCKKCPILSEQNNKLQGKFCNLNEQNEQIRNQNENLSLKVTEQSQQIEKLNKQIEDLKKITIEKQTSSKQKKKVEYLEDKVVESEKYSEISNSEVEVEEASIPNNQNEINQIDTEDLIENLDSGEQQAGNKNQIIGKSQINDESLKEIQKNTQKKVEKKNKMKKQEKIIKQTITYRVFYHRYTFDQFQHDLRESEKKNFTQQEIFQMLTNEPFHLTENQVDVLYRYCFLNDENIKIKKLITKMRLFFDDFDLLQEEEEEKIRQKLTKILKKKQRELKSEFKKKTETDEISKTEFVRILTEKLSLSSQQVNFCLCESVVVSEDIAHIKYKIFLDRFLT